MESSLTTQKREFDALKEDYSLVLMDVETLECEKRDLAGEVEGLQQCVKGLKQENDMLKKGLEDMRMQVKNIKKGENNRNKFNLNSISKRCCYLTHFVGTFRKLPNVGKLK